MFKEKSKIYGRRKELVLARFKTSAFTCGQYIRRLLCHAPKQEPVDDRFSKFKGIIKSKRLARKDRQGMFRDFEKADTSNIFRELDLD